MFFTPELVAKRDSGFGLLWLAATLGSRSNFKKLPKRSVLTANIGQLCDLISEPAEPLALRLSSNLMFGVVRVYKVKQEIFMSDVTNCVASLKKVVQDLRSSGALDGQIQMANPISRLSALTIVPDPKAAYVLDYDAFVADWDEYLNIGADTTRGSDIIVDESHKDFNPNPKSKTRGKSAAKVPQVEAVRKEVHTLEEHHQHLLSASFDLSFHNNSGHEALAQSSSQAAAVFDNFFAFSDGLDVGDGLGDDLARELGWGISPTKSANANNERDQADVDINLNHDDNFLDIDFNFNADNLQIMDEGRILDDMQPFGTPIAEGAQKKAKPESPQIENPVDGSRMGSVMPQNLATSPANAFARLLLSRDMGQPQPFADITNNVLNEASTKRLKRTRLLLDARTELTDDELKIAREKYLESQNAIRREIMTKRLQRENTRIIDDLIWRVPQGIKAPGLINFWQENFKVQVDARSGALRIYEEDERPSKRRKNNNLELQDQEPHANVEDHQALDPCMDWGVDQWDAGNNYMDMGVVLDDAGGNRHSSEEPGQARRISRSASVLGAGNLGFDLGPRDPTNGSQRSSLFPWDNAGPSSSTGNEAFPIRDGDLAIEAVDVRLRSRSLSHGGTSPLAPNRRGSAAGVILSPAEGRRNLQVFSEDFVFDVENSAIPENIQLETQKSDLNLVTLERNSFNFLEYAKMQYQTLSKPAGRLTFDTVVPKSTSTRHVAASAFYHCLVLATKNLLSLEQQEPYGSVIVSII